MIMPINVGKTTMFIPMNTAHPTVSNCTENCNMTGFEVILIILFIFNFCTLIFGFHDRIYETLRNNFELRLWKLLFPAYFLGYAFASLCVIKIGKKE